MTKWIPEFVGRSLALGTSCIGGETYNYCTFNAPEAIKFDTKVECDKFIKNLPPQTFISKTSLSLLESKEHSFVN